MPIKNKNICKFKCLPLFCLVDLSPVVFITGLVGLSAPFVFVVLVLDFTTELSCKIIENALILEVDQTQNVRIARMLKYIH